MICEFIDQMRAEGHAVESICGGLRKAGLQIAARTYRMWTSSRRAVAARVVSDAEVEVVVGQLVWKPDAQGRQRMQPAGLYGRRKMLAEVRRAGLATASPDAVDRAMRTLGLSGVVRAKKVYTTSQSSDALGAPDLLDRDFTSDRPDRVRVADFTYDRTWAGFTYVAFIVDVFAQRIVAWNAETTTATDLVMTPLRMALWQRDREGHQVEPKSLISHVDAGSQGGFNRSSQHLTFVVTVDARPELRPRNPTTPRDLPAIAETGKHLVNARKATTRSSPSLLMPQTMLRTATSALPLRSSSIGRASAERLQKASRPGRDEPSALSPVSSAGRIFARQSRSSSTPSSMRGPPADWLRPTTPSNGPHSDYPSWR